MVHLVDDDVVEAVGCDRLEQPRSRELLDRREDDIAAQIARGSDAPCEAGVRQDGPERAGRLGEQLPAMREEEHLRRRAAGLRERSHVERGEVRLAQTRREHDERPLLTRGARVVEGRQRVDLDVSGLGWRTGLVLCVPERERRGTSPGAPAVVVEPLRVDGAGRCPEGLGGVRDAVPCRGIESALDPDVPLDAVLERRPGQIGAPDVCHPISRRLAPSEDPRFRVERTPDPVRPDDAQPEVAGHPSLVALRRGVRGRAGLEVQQALERVRLRDVEVVAGDQPKSGATLEHLLEGRLEDVQPRGLNERRHEHGLFGTAEQGTEVAAEMSTGVTVGERVDAGRA